MPSVGCFIGGKKDDGRLRVPHGMAGLVNAGPGCSPAGRTIGLAWTPAQASTRSARYQPIATHHLRERHLVRRSAATEYGGDIPEKLGADVG